MNRRPAAELESSDRNLPNHADAPPTSDGRSVRTTPTGAAMCTKPRGPTRMAPWALLSDFALTDRVVFVTGAGRGIGRAIALDAAASGAFVIGCSRTGAELETLESEIAVSGGRCRTVVADVSQRDDVRAAIEFAVQVAVDWTDSSTMPKPTPSSRRSTTPKQKSTPSSTSTIGPSTGAACRCATDDGAGHGGQHRQHNEPSRRGGRPGRSPYSGVKAGVNNLSKSLAAEWAPYGIRVNALAPTVTRTALGEPPWLSGLSSPPRSGAEPLRPHGRDTRDQPADRLPPQPGSGHDHGSHPGRGRRLDGGVRSR